MIQNDEDPVADGANLVSCLAWKAPNLELVTVTACLVKVFLVVESQLTLPIIPAMIVIEEQVVVGWDWGQTVRVVIRWTPDLCHNVL